MRKKAGFARLKTKSLRVDMTPMVDLGFLLISFFVFTAALSRPAAMDLYMPRDGAPMPLGESNALTVLLDRPNTMYCYAGEWENAVAAGAVYKTGFSGKMSLREIIIHKQQALDANPDLKEGRKGLMLLIKPTERATYKNLVDVLDETYINSVKNFAVVKISASERTWLDRK